MATIISKTDTGRDDRDGDRIFDFNKEVVAFSNTQPGLTALRVELVEKQGILTRIQSLVSGGTDIGDVVGSRDLDPASIQRDLDRIAAAIVEVDEALSLFP